jgi:hypothetical protein
MSRIALVETKGKIEAQKAFKEIEAAFGRVPNLFKAYALYLPLTTPHESARKSHVPGSDDSLPPDRALHRGACAADGVPYPKPCVAAPPVSRILESF